MAIRYNKQLQNEIYKAVRSFNAKITRLERKGVSAALLPDRLSTKSIKANYTNRRQLRSFLSGLQEFSSKGQTFRSEGGVTGTTLLFEYNVKRANKATRKLKGELNTLAQIPTRYPMMKSENVSLLESKMNYLRKDIYKLNIQQINIFKRNIEVTMKSREKETLFHSNFKKMLLSVGYRSGMNINRLDRIAMKFDRLPANTLLRLYRTNPAFSIIEWYKAPDGTELSEDDIDEAYSSMENILDIEIAKE